MDRGDKEYVLTWLYNPSVDPKSTVIKYDLEYVANHWRDPSFDLWEEVRGDHFFTRMVQRRALFMGAVFAQKMGDQAAADFYKTQAENITRALGQHWDNNRNILVATLNYAGGVDYKNSGLDVAIILGALYGEWDNNFSVNDARVTRTFEKLIQAFTKIYQVNSIAGVPGVAIGRYPEDRYAGSDFNGGNPWVLATLAGAELYYRLAGLAAQNPNTLALAKKLLSAGDDYVQRVQFHANPDGSLSEQINRFNGYMMSARDLTWNYAAVERTFWARQLATSRMPRFR
jgi:glucoamylase